MTLQRQSTFACPCVNVRITVADAGGGGSVRDGRLQEDVDVAKDIHTTISIAQPLLTTRIDLLPPSTLLQDAASWTALACLNCDTNVYAVDKALQLHLETTSTSASARHVGFAAGGTGRDRTSSISAPPPPNNRVTAIASDDEEILRPVPGEASVRLLAGILCGADAIETLSASQTFSQSYGLVVDGVADGEEEDKANGVDAQAAAASGSSTRSGRRRVNVLGEDLRSEGDVRRTSSPQRAIPFEANKRTSSSPSPARRRRMLALAEEEEEEQGEDLDTLHLLETLLPHLPASIVADSKQGRPNDPSVRRHLSTPQRASDKSPSSNRQLDAKLDSVALAQLRERRDTAQRELYEVLKAKSAELAKLERRLRLEARQLRERALQHANSRADLQQKEQDRQMQMAQQAQDGSRLSGAGENDVTGNADGREAMSPLFMRRRPLVPAMEKTKSQDSDSARRTGVAATAMSATSSSSTNNNNNNTANGSGAIAGSGNTPIPGNFSSSQNTSAPFVGSYLSASFAMRGRDLPNQAKKEPERSEEEEEEWFAHKKRLRERYPHADHSALPSAVNSDDEGAVEVKENPATASTDEEEEGRGRGRARASERSASNTQKTPTPPRKKDSPGGQQKKGGSDQKRTSRERRRPSDNAAEASPGVRAKRGALKTVNGGVESATPAPAEKKVAFASTTTEVEAAPVSQVDESHEMELPIEQGDSVFEIDEDMDADDTTPTSSDITLGEDAKAATGSRHGEASMAAEDEAFDDERVPTDDEDESALDESIVKSLPYVGSFAALAQVESRSRRNSKSALEEESRENFDPASLRFDGREVYSSVPAGPISTASYATTSPNTEQRTSGSGGEGLNSEAGRGTATFIQEKEALLAGFPHERLHRSSAIGFRVAVGEAEAVLSGILAPNVPSHRNLYSARHQSGLAARKYKPVDDADSAESEDEAAEEHKGGVGKGKVRSEPVQVQSQAWARRLEATSTTPNTEGSDDLLLARSVPIDVRRHAFGALSGSSSTIHRDGTSGFDLEPKTSLPYQEKLFTPSLRKATRHFNSKKGETREAAAVQRRPSLAAIADAPESVVAAQHVVPGRPPLSRDSSSKDSGATKTRSGSIALGAGAKTGLAIAGAGVGTASTATQVAAPPFTYAVPGSVTRGFEPGVSATTTAGTTSAAHLTLASDALASLQNSPMLGSSAGTGRSSRLRSPRPPYTPPPPPLSSEVRLTPDAQHRPAALPLAQLKQADVYEEGEEESDLDNALTFMHTLEQLKRNKRTGWLHHRVQQPESIADHMYRMALLSMLLPQAEVDIGKCVQLCLVHDIAEALVGDLTPLDNVGKEEKLRREEEALNHLVHGLLAGSEAGVRIEALWHEYEDRVTPESRAVKDLDRFELALQAVEYERRYQTVDLQPFYRGSSELIEQPRIQRWIRRLAREREELWKGTQYAYEQTYPDGDDERALPPWKATDVAASAQPKE